MDLLRFPYPAPVRRDLAHYRRPIRTNKPKARAIPPILFQRQAKQLGAFLIYGRVRLQLVA